MDHNTESFSERVGSTYLNSSKFYSYRTGFSFDVARNAIVRGMTRIREDGDVERLGDRPFQDFLAFSEDLKISEFHPCDVAAGSCQTSDDSPTLQSTVLTWVHHYELPTRL